MTGNGRQARNKENNRARIGRRGCLKLGAGLATAAAAGGLATGRARAAPDGLEDPAPAGLEVGGGATYDRVLAPGDADAVVRTRGELLDALDGASAGDVVYVADSATIDLTGSSGISLADDVTLASGRGDGSDGALLYTDGYPDSLFKVYGDRVRFTGLRVRGPRWEYFTTSDHDRDAARGLWLLGEDCEVDNCQLYGWPYAAVGAGARGYANRIHVHHCSIHHNQLEGLGYGVDLLNGHSLVEHTYFDYNRHSIDGFGYATNGYEARYNLVGPNPVSHAFDMHGLAENGVAGGNRAGGTIEIHHNTFRFTHDRQGRAQEAVAIRGVPADAVRIDRNWFAHPERPDGQAVDAHGQAYRQGNVDGDGWRGVWASGNVFGDRDPPSDVGCPRDRTRRPASAVSTADGGERAGISVAYPNPFARELTITDLAIEPRSSSIARLADGTYDEGRWASEIHARADVRDGCTDVGGGLDLPASVDLDADGHRTSPDTEPVLSPGSTASFALARFRDGAGNAVDVDGAVVDLRVGYRLDDGTTGVDAFSIQPRAGDGRSGPGGALAAVGDATAVDPDGAGVRAGVAFDVENRFDRRLTVTDVAVRPRSEAVARLADGTYDEGRWASEIHARADVRDGCTDVGGGLDLPASVDLDADGHRTSPDTEPVLSQGSTASFALARFEGRDGTPLDMVGRQVDVELGYELADGTTGTAAVTLEPGA